MGIWNKRYDSFREKLKAARLDANLSQTEVAKILKKEQSYISKCESGERRVDVIELSDFAYIYKKPLDFL